MKYTQQVSEGQVHLSPEGLEETVERCIAYFVTITQGGKYRLYMADGDEVSSGPSYNTLEEAVQEWAGRMLVMSIKIAQQEKIPGLVIEDMSERGREH